MGRPHCLAALEAGTFKHRSFLLHHSVLCTYLRYFEIERWGRHPRQIYSDLTPQSWWAEGGGFGGGNDCNALRGMDSSDGQFHALVQRDERLWIFDPQLCRRIPLVYEVCTCIH